MSHDEAAKIDWKSVRYGTVGSAKNRWPSETRDLTPWVITQLDDLGRKLGMHLELTGTEVPVGTFRADITTRDDADRLVIIENQLGPSDHGHFGQIVLYACESRADAIIWLVANNPRFFISGALRSEHCRALDRLNKVFAGKIEFYGVEVTLESEPRPLDAEPAPMRPWIKVVVRPSSVSPAES